MSRGTLITAIGEASYIDDQSKYSQKFNSQLSKRLSHKGAFPDFLPQAHICCLPAPRGAHNPS